MYMYTLSSTRVEQTEDLRVCNMPCSCQGPVLSRFVPNGFIVACDPMLKSRIIKTDDAHCEALAILIKYFFQTIQSKTSACTPKQEQRHFMYGIFTMRNIGTYQVCLPLSLTRLCTLLLAANIQTCIQTKERRSHKALKCACVFLTCLFLRDICRTPRI